MSSTRQFIDQLAAGETSAAKETISNDLSARAFESLDSYKKEIASTLFGGTKEVVVEENYHDPKHHDSVSEHDYHTSHSDHHGYPLNHVTGKGTGSLKDHSTGYLKKAHEAHSEVVDNEYESAHPDNNDGEKDHHAMSLHTHAKKAVNDIEHELKSRKKPVPNPINNSHYKFD